MKVASKGSSVEDVWNWHDSEGAVAVQRVRLLRYSGPEMLAASLSQSDPQETWVGDPSEIPRGWPGT